MFTEITFRWEFLGSFLFPAHRTQKSHFAGCDVTGGRVEYNIPDALGPSTNHTKAREFQLDVQCPQHKNNTLEIVRCTAHQHIGARCMHAYVAETGELICSSCPTYGQVKGEVS